MTVVVAPAAGDDRDRGPQLAQLGREPRIGGTVVRDLQDLDAPGQQRCGHVGLRVCGQERVDLAVARQQDDGEPVRVLRGRSGTIRPEHAQAESAEPVGGAGSRLHDLDAALSGCGKGLPLFRTGRLEGWVEYALDSDPAEDGRRTADVVALGMREDERGQATDAELAKLLAPLLPSGGPWSTRTAPSGT